MANRRRPLLRLFSGLIIALVGASLVTASLSADFSGRAWRYYKPVVLPSGLATESLVEVVPDAEVFAHARPGLSDVRIVAESSQQEVPYKLLVERGEQRRSSIAVSVRDLWHVPGQFTSFVVDLGQEGVLHNELEIRTPSRNFQRRVVVEASDDAQAWAVLEERGLIFDLTIPERNFTESNTRVGYPSSTARYLRIRIINGGDPPLEVSGAVAYFSQALPPRETDLTATVASRQESTDRKSTFLVLDLGSEGLPTSRLSVATPQENFYRQVILEGSNDAEAWDLVQGSGALYAYNTPKFVGSKLSLSYPETTFRYLRLTILNEDNPPLPVAGVRVHGFLRKLIFFATPDSTYLLYYGNASAGAPSYELERIFPYLVTENLPGADLGNESVNPLFAAPPEPAEPFTERYPWLLPVALAFVGLLVGLLLTSLLRKVRPMLPPPGPTP